jgi:pyruvate/2-oxoglutarate/acetoin dehydrogenase E1 component
LFFEPMSLAHAPREPVQPDEHVEIGTARLARKGSDVTVVAIGSMVIPSLRAAEIAAASDGPDVEVIDLRSIRPLDTNAVVQSVSRTRRLVVAHESWVTGGIGAEVLAAIVEACPQALCAPGIRVGTAPVPTPSGKVRPHAVPNAERIGAAIRRVLAA